MTASRQKILPPHWHNGEHQPWKLEALIQIPFGFPLQSLPAIEPWTPAYTGCVGCHSGTSLEPLHSNFLKWGHSWDLDMSQRCMAYLCNVYGTPPPEMTPLALIRTLWTVGCKVSRIGWFHCNSRGVPLSTSYHCQQSSHAALCLGTLVLRQQHKNKL